MLDVSYITCLIILTSLNDSKEILPLRVGLRAVSGEALEVYGSEINGDVRDWFGRVLQSLQFQLRSPCRIQTKEIYVQPFQYNTG